MRTETNQYEAAHGKQPKGQGDWAFDVIHWTGLKNERSFLGFFAGTFSEAKRAAAKQAKEAFGKHLMMALVVLS